MDWPLVIICGICLTYIPHLLLRAPAVHLKLARDKKTGKGGGYDLRAPRASQNSAADDSPEGYYIARLNGQHANSFEGLIILLAALLASVSRGVALETINFSCTCWLLSRLLHTIFYIFGGGSLAHTFSLLRALSFVVGIVSNLYLLFCCL